MAESRTYFKLVCDPFTEEVVRCGPGEAVGQDCTWESLFRPLCLYILAVPCHACSDKLQGSVVAA